MNNKRQLIRILVSVIFLMLFSSSAYPGRSLYGAGNDSCEKWVTDRKDGKMFAWLSSGHWVLGFVTSAQFRDFEMQQVGSTDTILIWIDNYCAKNPIKNIYDVASALVEELRIKQ
jgi:hypothetical protein